MLNYNPVVQHLKVKIPFPINFFLVYLALRSFNSLSLLEFISVHWTYFCLIQCHMFFLTVTSSKTLEG